MDILAAAFKERMLREWTCVLLCYKIVCKLTSCMYKIYKTIIRIVILFVGTVICQS